MNYRGFSFEYVKKVCSSWIQTRQLVRVRKTPGFLHFQDTKAKTFTGQGCWSKLYRKSTSYYFQSIITVNHKQNKAQHEYRIEGSFLTYCFSQGDPTGHRCLGVTAAAAQGILLPATMRGSCCNRLKERISILKQNFNTGKEIYKTHKPPPRPTVL